MALTEGVEPRSEAAPQASGEIDPATLEWARRGDSAALERFIRHYERPLFAFLSRMTGRGPHVEDLAQEVFLRVYRALPRFERREGARVSTWLFSIAWRLCVDRSRKRTPQLLPVEGALLVAAGSSPEKAERRSQIASAIERAAGELSTEQRVVFVLTECHGLTTAEVAEVTGASRATVKTRLFRARARLRRSLRGLWEDER